jgi:predicted site-specific integrase-resolvase
MKDVLERWKHIADYLDVSEKTAKRYGKSKGLPVKINKAGHPIITKKACDDWRYEQPTAT